MFLGSQNFPGSLGPYFVGGVIRIIFIFFILKYDIKQMIAYSFVGKKVRGQGLPTKATNIGPQ